MPPFVSASVVVIDEHGVLLVVDPIRNEPVLPGGHVRWAEMPQAAAEREAREETGLHVAVGPLLGVYAGSQLAGEQGIVRVVFHGTIAGGALRSSREGEAIWTHARDYSLTSARDAPIVRDALAGGQTAYQT